MTAIWGESKKPKRRKLTILLILTRVEKQKETGRMEKPADLCYHPETTAKNKED